MKSSLLLTSLFCLSLIQLAARPLGFLQNNEPDFIIDTTVTPAGEQAAQASREHPVYYVGFSRGYEQFGGSIAGEVLPSEKSIHDYVAKLLRDQGFVGTSKAERATQLLTLSWGTYRQMGGMSDRIDAFLVRFMGGDKLDIMWETQPHDYFKSAYELRRNMLTNFSRLILDAARGDVYLFALKSFDYEAYKNGKLQLLWETRIACPAEGLDIEKTFPMMIKAGAPAFAKKMDRPAWINGPDILEGKVTYGELQVINYDKDPGSDSAGNLSNSVKQ